MNFLDCLTELRINAAKELLTDPFRSAAEVASMVGYEDSSYFARTFKKRTGMTPTQYRREAAKAAREMCIRDSIRPDHGRQLWEEGPGNCRPGYGKYDRALGIQYMLGVWAVSYTHLRQQWYLQWPDGRSPLSWRPDLRP